MRRGDEEGVRASCFLFFHFFTISSAPVIWKRAAALVYKTIHGAGMQENSKLVPLQE